MPGDRQESGGESYRGQNATQQDRERGFHSAGFSVQEGIDAERPAEAEHPELRFVEIEAQQIQCGSENEEQEEASLERTPTPLQLRPTGGFGG